MARISNKDKYPIDNSIDGSEYIIGTDTNKKTLNYRVDDLKSYILNGDTSGGGSNGGGGDGSSDGDGWVNSDGTYTWVKYSESINGLNMTDVPTSTSTYIGIAYNQSSIVKSDDPNDYRWDLIDGDGFSDGNGTFTWVKYSLSVGATSILYDSADGMVYMGLALGKLTSVESDNYLDYEWHLISVSSINGGDGVDGGNGGDGNDGNDGILDSNGTYTWVKYADDANGLNMVDVPIDTSLYIGLSYNNISSVESNIPIDYTWSLINGGGIADGNGTYTWIKYSLSYEGLTPMQDSPVNMTYMGISLNNISPTESDNYLDYEWHLINAPAIEDSQNNKVRIVEIYNTGETAFTRRDIANAVNNAEYPLIVEPIENIIFNIVEPDVVIPPPVDTLDFSKDLVLTVTEDTSTQATMNWVSEDTAIVKYSIVYTNLVTGEYTVDNLDDILVTQKILTGLVTGDTYSCYVTAYDTLNNTKLSNVVEFILYADSVTPVLYLNSYTDTTVDLTWSVDPLFEHTRFELYESFTGRIYTTSDSLDLGTVISGLLPNTTYTFYVIAFNAITQSNNSNSIIVTTSNTVPDPLTTPIITYISDESNSITFGVDVPIVEDSKLASYRVAYKVLNSTTWIERIVNKNNIQILNLLEQNTTYVIKLQTIALDLITTSAWSNELIQSTHVNLGVSVEYTPIQYGNGVDIRIYDGTPNGTVTVAIKGLLEYNNTITGLAYTGLVNANFSSTADLYNQQIFSVVLDLDANGEYLDVFNVGTGASTEGTATYLFLLGNPSIKIYGYLDIIASSNGINPDKSGIYIKMPDVNF